MEISMKNLIFLIIIFIMGCGGESSSSPSEVNANLSPTAFAGEDQIVHQQVLVTLTGTGTDSDGTITTFSWQQVAGNTVSLSADNTDIVNFTSLPHNVEETLTFELTVTDDEGASAVDTIFVTVSKPQEISGVVLDYKTNIAIPNATILASYFVEGLSYQLGEALSSSDGSFLISYYQPVIGRINLSADATAYAAHSIIVETIEGAMDVNSNISLLPVYVSQTFDANNDVTINIDEQPAVIISGGSLVREDGVEIKGQVTGKLTIIDASTDTKVMPGDFLSINNANVISPIESFGALTITFVDEEGSKLNLNDGETAQIYIPLSSSQDPVTSQTSIPLFYYDENKGYWIEEGVSTLTELEDGVFAYVGTVSHFTTWNADKRYDRSYVIGCLRDENGARIRGADITINGLDYIGYSYGRSDGNGEFKVAVKPLSLVSVKISYGAIPDTTTITYELDTADVDQETSLLRCSDPDPIGTFSTAELSGNSFNVYFDQLGSIIYHFSANNSGTVADIDDGEFGFSSVIDDSGTLIVTTEYFEDSYTLTSGNSSSGTLDIHIVDFTGEGISDEIGTITKVGENKFTKEAVSAGDFRVTFGSLGYVTYHFFSDGTGTIDDGDGKYECTWLISAGSLVVTTEDDEDTYTLTSGIPSSGTIDIHIVSSDEGILDEIGTIELRQ